MEQTAASCPNGPQSREVALNELIISVFRLNGALLASGDRLVRDLGLTSARWQVLGAIALSQVPLPVAHIARNMGLTRQAVQRVVDDMHKDGFVRLDPNPHHRRAMLVAMTQAGEAAYDQATARQLHWAANLARDIPATELGTAAALIQTLNVRLAEQLARTDHRSD